MINLRTFGTDNNPAGASAFCAVPVPVGTTDGDLVLVGLSLPTGAGGVTITPPDGWTLASRTDPALAWGLAVYYRFALNENARWVFELSSSVQVAGAALVYSGVDASNPIEAAVGNPSNVTTVTATSVGDEALALFLGATAAGTFTPATGFLQATAKTQVNATIAAHRKSVAAAGAVAPVTTAFSSAVDMASVLLVLRPSFGVSTVDDVYRRIIGLFPAGVDSVYDLTTDGDYYRLFRGIAEVLKTYAFDLVDTLRREIIPYKALFKLPDWERIFGLTTTRTALVGTVPSRQAQVLSSWRAAAQQGSSIPEVQATAAPLLGYNAGTIPAIIECPRAALMALHTYTTGTSDAIPDNNPAGVTRTFVVDVDGGAVSTGGARVTVEITHPVAEQLTATLTGPGGDTKTWSAFASGNVTAETYELYGVEFVGADIQGTWTLVVKDTAAGSTGTLLVTTLFVEGVAPRQETAAAIFDWGIYADPAHIGENGTPADFAALRNLIQHMAQAHTVANVIQSETPYPDTDAGIHAAIPDECIPV